MANDAVSLEHGYVRVDGALAVNQGRISVVPAAHSNYEVLSLASGKTYVRVYTGSVQLSGLDKPYTVAAGTAISYDAPNNATAPQAQAAGAAGAAAGTSAAVGVMVPLLVVASVIAVTAIVVAQATSSSPTQP